MIQDFVEFRDPVVAIATTDKLRYQAKRTRNHYCLVRIGIAGDVQSSVSGNRERSMVQSGCYPLSQFNHHVNVFLSPANSH
ncbi:MAG: hypothetical protein VKJ64_03100 [Leptolyngbyaceae bacterium]|nr:hypothetical protein [Leptolyngbyaceae bacterium]